MNKYFLLALFLAAAFSAYFHGQEMHDFFWGKAATSRSEARASSSPKPDCPEASANSVNPLEGCIAHPLEKKPALSTGPGAALEAPNATKILPKENQP